MSDAGREPPDRPGRPSSEDPGDAGSDRPASPRPLLEAVAGDDLRTLEAVLWRMPFGKYAGVPLVDLPEPYLVWFRQRGFPRGRLGDAMSLALEIKTNGLEELLRPLRWPTSGDDDRTPERS